MAAVDTEQTQPEISGPQIALSAEKEAEYERITRNLAEMTSGEILRKVLAEDRTVKCYWGKSTLYTGVVLS
jgi:tyrosyl-tRNA synthetase